MLSWSWFISKFELRDVHSYFKLYCFVVGATTLVQYQSDRYWLVSSQSFVCVQNLGQSYEYFRDSILAKENCKVQILQLFIPTLARLITFK